MRRGGFRTLLSIERRATGQDAAGEQLTTWTAIGTAWCRVITLTGREAEAAQAVRAADTHTIRLIYFAGLTAKDRFVYTDPDLGTVYYNISAVADLDKRHRYQECTASEGLASG